MSKPLLPSKWAARLSALACAISCVSFALPASATHVLGTAQAFVVWSDRLLLFVTCGLTMFSDLTVAIAVGTALGLGQRLLSRGEPPADWTPPER